MVDITEILENVCNRIGKIPANGDASNQLAEVILQLVNVMALYDVRLQRLEQSAGNLARYAESRHAVDDDRFDVLAKHIGDVEQQVGELVMDIDSLELSVSVSNLSSGEP